jgi:hypothetical protein
MEFLLKDIPSVMVKHVAAEARALDISELQDYTLARRLTHQSDTYEAQDDLIGLFLKCLSPMQIGPKNRSNWREMPGSRL